MPGKSYIVFDSNKNETYEIVSLAAFSKRLDLNESCLRAASVLTQAQHRGLFIKPTNSSRDLENEFVQWCKLNEKAPKKEPLDKQKRYNQSDLRVYFGNNIAKIYQDDHITKRLSCTEIGKLYDTNTEIVRRSFNSLNLPAMNHSKPHKGKDHHAYQKLSEKGKELADNFDVLFRKHHHTLNEPVYKIANDYDICATTIFNYCRKHDIPFKQSSISSPHAELNKFLTDLGVEFTINDRRTVPSKELDIYIPSHRLAIEINGLYWHSDTKVGKNYHLEKLLLCEEHNIRLLQFWDSEIENNFDLVCSIILANLGKCAKVYARQTTIRKLEYKDIVQFLIDNHIQGGRTSHINYGLYDKNNTLVMVSTFINSQTHDYELARMCSKRNTLVVGGAQKLMKTFINDYKPKAIMSFCDRRLFAGTVYTQMGFDFKKNTPPNYWYWKNKYRLESRIKYQKHKLSKILKNFDAKLSEYENMTAHKFRRVYDCGSKMFIMNIG